MLRCRICNCFSDPGDLVNGICEDCRKELEQKEQKEELLEFMLRNGGEQMSINDFI